MSDNENTMDDFEAWHAGLNKLVKEDGQPVLMSDAFDTKAVLATPQEVEERQARALSREADPSRPTGDEIIQMIDDEQRPTAEQILDALDV